MAIDCRTKSWSHLHGLTIVTSRWKEEMADSVIDCCIEEPCSGDAHDDSGIDVVHGQLTCDHDLRSWRKFLYSGCSSVL